ncbi:MAG: NAD(P)H-hydrate epimerase [Calditrichaeota bacterium]|nr:MAG: NAD(P)H-hydrate epimerase [Calditrichota bacterium]
MSEFDIRFCTREGFEVPAVTAEQMREVDRIAVQETGPNLFQMMENAGRNLAELALELLGPAWSKARVLVLAGGGGNGGGGICAARHLATRGVRVSLCLASPERLAEVTAFQRKIFGATQGEEIHLDELTEKSYDLILDALIGYSLQSAPRGRALDLIAWANSARVPILSLDVPSGVDVSTGDTPGVAVRPTWTLTLALPKAGLRAENCGQLYLADIGIPAGTFARAGIQYVSPFREKFVVRLRILEVKPERESR